MTTTSYFACGRCHACGHTYLVCDPLLFPGGPTQAGSLPPVAHRGCEPCPTRQGVGAPA